MGVERFINNEQGELFKNQLALISGTGNCQLAKKIGAELNIPVDFPVSYFPESEAYCQLSEGLRRKHAIILQSFSCGEINNQLLELLIMIDASKRASAEETTVLLPYFPYARQDRKDKPRVPITAALLSNLLETAGANRVVTLSLHAEQIMGCFNGPWDNLYASYSLIPKIKNICHGLGINDIANEVAFFSPDSGGVKRVDFYARIIGCQYGVIPKIRDANTLETSQLNILAGFPLNQIKAAFTIDDLIASGSTTCKGADILSDQGIPHVFAVAEHALFLNNALEKINNSSLSGVITTDTIAHDENVIKSNKIEIVSVAPLLAMAIRYIHTGESLGENLIL